MIITCRKCKAQFNLDEDRIPAHGTQVRCSVCNDVFPAFPSVNNGDYHKKIESEPEQTVGNLNDSDYNEEIEFTPEQTAGRFESGFEETKERIEFGSEQTEERIESGSEETEGRIEFGSEETDETLDESQLEYMLERQRVQTQEKNLLEGEYQPKDSEIRQDFEEIRQDFENESEQKQTSKTLITIAAIIFFTGILYGIYTILESKNIKVPYMSDILNPNIEMDQGNSRITVSDMNARFIESRRYGKIFVITGSVQNSYDHPRSYIKLTGKLFTKGKILAQKRTFPCGNTIPLSDITLLNKKTLIKKLNNPAGQNKLNINIQSHKMIPYMMVFFDFPKQLDEYAVEPISSVKATSADKSK